MSVTTANRWRLADAADDVGIRVSLLRRWAESNDAFGPLGPRGSGMRHYMTDRQVAALRVVAAFYEIADSISERVPVEQVCKVARSALHRIDKGDPVTGWLHVSPLGVVRGYERNELLQPGLLIWVAE